MAVTINGDTGVDKVVDNTITTDDIQDGAITAAKIASGAIPNSYAGTKNLIINGDMRIDQRNAGSAVTSASNVYLTDRWQLQISGTTNTPSFQQVTDAPTGFQYSLKATSNGSETISVTDAVTPRQRIEGYNSAQLLYGTANAKTITVSFWVKSSLTGTWNVAINNSAFNRSYVTEYTISSANTWEYKTVTILGDTSGTWNTDNTTGIVVMFPVDAGTNLNGTANTWLSGNYRTTSGSNRLLQTSGATWQITGVQLEVGDTATDFENLQYGQQLALCQRYYQQVSSELSATAGLGCAYYESATSSVLDLRLTTQMRTSPTGTISSASDFIVNTPALAGVPSSISFYAPTLSSVRLRLIHASDTYQARGIRFGTTSGRVNAEAEL